MINKLIILMKKINCKNIYFSLKDGTILKSKNYIVKMFY